MAKGHRINWTEIEKKAGRTLEDMHSEYKSTRKMGKLLGVSYDVIGRELRRRGVVMRRGGKNNSKGHYIKPKSGRVCDICGKDPAPNWFRCKTCNEPESWIEDYGFSL